jgi:SSS family solute:Na+ symporter
VKAGGGNAQLSVPLLFEHMFPSWFAGIGYSAIVIGALVPAAIMSIAAANLFTRNIYKEFFKPDASPAHQARVARFVSLIVKGGALVFALTLSKTFSINLQLLGGIWILQTFPAIVAGLYTRWFHRWALLLGWAAAMVYGTIQAYRVPIPGQANSHFGGSTAPVLGHIVYIAVVAFIINLLIAVAFSIVFRAFRLPAGTDETQPGHYTADPETGPPAPAPTAAATPTAGSG